LLITRPAEVAACSLSPYLEHVLDPAEQQVDTMAPSLSATLLGVERGRGPTRAGCRQGASSCDDLGTVRVTVTPSDDRTPAERMGYEVRLLDGPSAPIVHVETTPMRAEGGVLVLYLFEQDAVGEALHATLEITPIDLAGQRGAPVVVDVDDPGAGGGCRLAGAGGGAFGGSALLLAAACLALRRRRSP
jgi:hypothetical protein